MLQWLKTFWASKPRTTVVAVLCLVIAWTTSGVGWAQVTVVGSADRPYNAALIQELRALLSDPVQIVAPGSGPVDDGRTRLLIALGPEALRAALQQRRVPILSLVTSRETFRELAQMRVRSGADAQVTALFGEPNPLEQLRLVHAFYQRPVSLGVLVTARSAQTVEDIRAAAASLNITLVPEPLAADESGGVGVAEVARGLNAKRSVDAWLALPDVRIFTSGNVRTLLLVTYPRNQPVFGFADSLVAAGSAASVWVTPQLLAAQVQEFVKQQLAGGRMPTAQYPRYQDVIANDQVAKSLGLSLDRVAHLRKFP